MQPHTGVQGPDSPHGEERVEGRTGHAQGVGPPCHLFGQVRRPGDHGAANDIRVPVQVLGRRVDDEVGPQLDGPLEHRREEGVVDHDHGVHGAGPLDDVRDVDHSKQRIARRLHPDHARFVRKGLVQPVRVGLIDKLQPELALPGKARKEPVGPSVTVVGRQDEVVRSQQLQDRRHRRHARGGHHSLVTALEIRQRLSQNVPRGIPRASVVVLALLSQSHEGEGGREMDGRDHGSVFPVHGHSRPNGAGLASALRHDGPPRRGRYGQDGSPPGAP